MTVATFIQPNFTSQDSATYKSSIDGSINVMSRVAAMFAPHETTPTSMRIRIDAGELLVNGIIIPQAAQETTEITPPVSASRIDLVVIDSSTAVIGLVTGTPSGTPVPPDLPVGKLPIAYIYLNTSTTYIANTMIDDRRNMWLTGSAQPRDIQNQTYIKCTAGGTVDAITASISPAPTQLYDRMRISLLSIGANTIAAPTLNLNSISAKTIVKGASTPLVAGDIPGANYPCIFEYVLAIDKWVLLNPAYPSTASSLGGISNFTNYTTVGAHTWIKPSSNIKFVIVLAVGGGGGGGAGWSCSSAYFGGGGGSGGVAVIGIIDVSAVASVDLFVGAGGTGGAYDGECQPSHSGNNGSASYFGTLTAANGIGGTRGYDGGAGGSSVVWTYLINYGFVGDFGGGGGAGNSAGTPGVGGRSGFRHGTGSSALYGSGGAGGGAGAAGANGAPGIVKIWY